MSQRTPAEIRALIRLLGDEDERTARIAREKLLETGEMALSYLAETVRDSDARIRGRSRILIETIRFELLKDRFRRYSSSPEHELDLETGVFLIAAYGYPEVDMEDYRRYLDQVALDLRDELARSAAAVSGYDGRAGAFHGRPVPPAVALLNEYLFVREGYRGNEEGYYEVDNSYLNRVIDRQLGIPISLSVLYMLIGGRLGLPLYGVALPGHFVVGYHEDLVGRGTVGTPLLDEPETALWIDPFHQGRFLTEADCYELVTRLGHGADPLYLQPAPVRLIIVRMLMNLARIYRYTDRLRQAEELRELIGIMTGEGPPEESELDV